MASNHGRRPGPTTIALASMTIVAAVAMATTARAAPMDGPLLKAAIAGKRIFLKIPLGGEFPLHYLANGTVDGKSPESLLARLDPKTDTGKWWIKGNMLCQQWTIWYDRKIYCFTLESEGGNALNWVRDDGFSGTARIGD